MNKPLTPPETEITPLTINHAVCAVMGELKRLKKEDKNSHGGYDFTSVDDFKDAIRPLMAKNGLSIHVSQNGFEMIEYTDSKDKRKSVAQFDIAITLHHISGVSDKPEIMTVALPFTGPQTSGAARSYAVKEWQKSRFLASAGDSQDEADLMEQSREGLRLSKADSRDLHTALVKEMTEQVEGADHDKLAEWWQENKYRIETLPKDWFIQLRTDYATAWKQLKAEAELDAMTSDELDALGMKSEEKENA